MRIRLAIAAATAAFAFAAVYQAPSSRAADAQEQPQAAADKCRGIDMLAETQATDPETYAKIMAQAAATENADALLWKIERPGRAASYLFGTVHLTDERITKLSPAVEQAIGGSKTIALEVSDISEKATAAIIAQSAPLVMFTDGRRLDGLLSQPEYEAVKKVISRSGMPSDLAALFKPWIVTMIMSVSDCERTSVQKGERVLDMKLAELGKSRGMQVVGLETIPEQLEALASVPEKQQLDMLRASLKFADRTNDLMETLVQLYLTRKISAALPFQIAIAKQVGIGDDAFAGFQEKLLIDRNAKMRTTAEPLLADGGVFIAVGALHLPGKQGLVALLREAGYTVTPIE
jgi:uncharacterized protein YbaP (TraB family)